MRTIGALGKAKYVGVSLSTLQELFGAGATIYVSIKHHGAMLGVDPNTAPRVETIRLGEPSTQIAIAAAPVTVHIEVPATKPAPKPEEKAEGALVSLGDY